MKYDVELLRESVIDKKKNRKSIVKDILKAKTLEKLRLYQSPF